VRESSPDCTLLRALTLAARRLHMEVSAFVEYISPTPVEHEIRGLIIESISKVVRRAYPDAQVLPFGSFETKLYLPLG
jgi:non-canonical poly(A) RNA polymerase PAPD5/7